MGFMENAGNEGGSMEMSGRGGLIASLWRMKGSRV